MRNLPKSQIDLFSSLQNLFDAHDYDLASEPVDTQPNPVALDPNESFQAPGPAGLIN